MNDLIVQAIRGVSRKNVVVRSIFSTYHFRSRRRCVNSFTEISGAESCVLTAAAVFLPAQLQPPPHPALALNQVRHVWRTRYTVAASRIRPTRSGCQIMRFVPLSAG